jgi:branched-subunit amino acid transport protein AzlD
MSPAFDYNPIIYWLAGYCIACCLCILVFLSPRRSPVNPERWYILLGSVLLPVMRLPVILFNRELNADESQMLTQAMTLLKDPVYFRSVDGTTGGPLGSYFLIIPGLIRGVFDYTTGHLGSLLLVIVTLVCFYWASRIRFGSGVAMAATFPLLLFFSFTQQQDFVHYSSEHLPMAMMAVIFLLISRYEKATSKSFGTPIGIGILIALLPFGKLQTLPMVLVLVLWGLYVFWKKGKLFSDGIWFIASGIGTLLIVAGLLIAGNVFQDFITFYIVGNFQYGGEISWLDNLIAFPSSLLKAPPIMALLAPLTLFVVYSVFGKKNYRSSDKTLLIFSLAWFFITLLAMSRTGSGYLHYWLFAIMPISGILISRLAVYTNPRIYTYFCLLCLGFMMISQAHNFLTTRTLNLYPSSNESHRHIPFSPVANEVLKLASSGEYLAVWGWNCQYYVETQMPQGIAENHSIRSIFKHPMQDVYLDRYLENLTQNKPVVIVDAIGKNSLWTQDKASQSLENYPSLFRYVSANYKLAKTIDDTRIYLRKDRL